MTTTLITGSNRGLGLETARRLVEAGHTVHGAMRDPQTATPPALSAPTPCSSTSTTRRASTVRCRSCRSLDVLVNNAGILGTAQGVDDLTPEAMLAVLQTNVVAVVRVTQAALPLLRASDAPVIVNVASGVGWPRALRGEDTDERHVLTVPYATSKAALITATVQYAKNLPAFRINATDPGYTATDFNGNSGHQTVTEGTDATVAMALVGPDGPTGEFHSRHGRIEY